MLVGKWAGFPYIMQGGFGVASIVAEGVEVAAAAVVVVACCPDTASAVADFGPTETPGAGVASFSGS